MSERHVASRSGSGALSGSGARSGARKRWARALSLAFPLVVFALLASCAWDPSRPFDRDAPQVKEAIGELDAGEAGAAAGRLQDYLSTGACKDGIIGTPDVLKRRADGTFDLGLALFRIGEQYGRRFGEEDQTEGVTEATRAQRHAQIECARRLAQAIAEDDTQPGDLRARAHYLSGNLAFLDGAYEDAVRSYDRALVLAPGEPDGGDPVGRDAAFNRAIALRRIEDNKKDSGADASPPGDASSDASREPDAGHDGGDSKDSGGADGASGGPDGGEDAGKDAEPPPSTPPDAGPEPPREAGASPPPSTDEDQRMLDQLENAPTLQQEEAKRFGKKRVRGMADK
jgi:tetratricopeptide (TPR) repeat protein